MQKEQVVRYFYVRYLCWVLCMQVGGKEGVAVIQRYPSEGPKVHEKSKARAHLILK